jgi:hypothetical protein
MNYIQGVETVEATKYVERVSDVMAKLQCSVKSDTPLLCDIDSAVKSISNSKRENGRLLQESAMQSRVSAGKYISSGSPIAIGSDQLPQCFILTTICATQAK